MLRVLVAEAQETSRRQLVQLLEDEKRFLVLQTSDREGVGHLLKQKIHILFLDSALAEGQLKDYLIQLRKSFPDLMVILTSFEDSSEIQEGFSQGIVDCLTKPVVSERLETALDKAVPVTEGAKKIEEAGDIKDHVRLEFLPSVQRHPMMKRAMALLQNVAESDITVLLSGPSGVGKEIFAKTLHTRSRRRQHRFVGINCASVPETLLEAELFGAEKGAYTGSVGQRIGKFELAQKGTLLLDEVSEMNVLLQSKLLRIIQEKEMYRVGGERSIKLDVRIVATTNRDLHEWVRRGNFREDLFYRLNVIAIEIPSLKERPEDIPVLARFLIEKINKDRRDDPYTLTMEAVEQLSRYDWPGNIRELENVLIRSVFLTSGRSIQTIHFDRHAASALNGHADGNGHASLSGKIITLEEMEKEMIRKALEEHTGNRTHAANALGISVRTLRNKLQLYRELDLPGGNDGDKTSIN